MNRQGSILLWCLVLLALGAVVSHASVRQWRSFSNGLKLIHQQEQAREWALGGHLLPHDKQVVVDEWTITHDATGTVTVRHESGTGWWLRRREGLIVDEGVLGQSTRGETP